MRWPEPPRTLALVLDWASAIHREIRRTTITSVVGGLLQQTNHGTVLVVNRGATAADQRGRYEAYLGMDSGDPPEPVLKLSAGRHRVLLQDTWTVPDDAARTFALPGSDGTYYLVLELTYPDTWEAWALVAAGDLPEQDHTNRVIIQAYVVVADGAFGQPEMLRAPGDIEVVPFREWDICVDGAAKKVMVAASAPYDGA
jgi:hypothetical protein